MDKKQNLKDFEYILSEIIRYIENFYSQKDSKKLSEFMRSESLSMLYKVPSNIRKDGEIIIGENAYSRLYDIANRVRKPSKINVIKNISIDLIAKSLMLEFEDAIISKSRKLDQNTVNNIISSTLNVLAKKQEYITHYFPVVFFEGFVCGTEFFNGLKILSKKEFLGSCKESFNENLKDDLIAQEKKDIQQRRKMISNGEEK